MNTAMHSTRTGLDGLRSFVIIFVMSIIIETIIVEPMANMRGQKTAHKEFQHLNKFSTLKYVQLVLAVMYTAEIS